MNVSIKELDEAIESAQQKIVELKERRKMIAEMTEDQKLAVELHTIKCIHFDSGNYCEWNVETDKNGSHLWELGDHREYLEKSNQLLSIADYETIIKIVEIF